MSDASSAGRQDGIVQAGNSRRRGQTRSAIIVTLACVGVVMAAGSANAATYTASELSYDSALLSQFNLINLGAWTTTARVYTSGSVVAGSVLTDGNGVGVGSTSSNTSFGATSSTTAGVVNATSGANQSYGALTVFGNVVGDVEGYTKISINGTLSGNSAATAGSYGARGAVSMVNNGTLNITGTLSASAQVRDTNTFNTTQSVSTYNPLNFNTNVPNKNYSNSSTPTTLATVFPFAPEQSAFAAPLKSLYSGLANLPGSVVPATLPTQYYGGFTGTGGFTYGTYSSTVGSTTYKYGVVNTTLAALSSAGSSFTGFQNAAGNNATFVIVTGDTGTLPTITNGGSNVIYDFVSAGTLTTAGNFNASILAPLANIVNNTGNISGTVVVASMTESQNLLNTNVFTGDLTGLRNLTYNSRVPEPASLTLIGVGIAAAAISRRRRRK